MRVHLTRRYLLNFSWGLGMTLAQSYQNRRSSRNFLSGEMRAGLTRQYLMKFVLRSRVDVSTSSSKCLLGLE